MRRGFGRLVERPRARRPQNARQALEGSAQSRREAGESLMFVGSSGRRRAT